MRVSNGACNTIANPNQTRCDLIMADPIIPPPCADGYWHFTYITTDPVDGRWYGGRHSTKRHPGSNRYLGSGNWIKTHPERDRLKREIVAFFDSSLDVCAAEAAMITWNHVFDDPLCMNLRDGGEGITIEGARILAANPTWIGNVKAAAHRSHSSDQARANHGAATIRNFSNPVTRAKHAAAITKRSSEPAWIESHAAAMRKNGANPIRNKRISAGLKARLADPIIMAMTCARIRAMAATLEWQKSNEAQRQNIYSNPISCAKRDDANRARATDATWLANTAAAQRKRASDPDARKKMTKTILLTMETPEWRAAQINGSRKRSENPVWRANQHTGALKREASKRAKRALTQ